MWFVSPTGGAYTDARYTAWADDDFQLSMTGAVAGPTQLQIPIVWNPTGALNPAAVGALGGLASELAHPTSDKWFIKRIIGDVMVQGQHVTVDVNNCIPTGPILVNMSLQHTATLGDGLVTYDPAANDGAVGRRRIHEWHTFVSPEFVGCHECPGENHDGATTDSTVVTAFQRFGVPTAKVIHIDVNPRVKLVPETMLTLIVTASSSCKDQDALFILPKLKVWLEQAM